MGSKQLDVEVGLGDVRAFILELGIDVCLSARGYVPMCL